MLILPQLKLHKFSTGFIPIKSNLFSLQLNEELTGVEMEQVLIDALLRMEFVRGRFGNVWARGRVAKGLMEGLEGRRAGLGQIGDRE